MAVSSDSASEDKAKRKRVPQGPPTKVVIRRLPPDTTAESLEAELGELPPHNFLYVAGPDFSLTPAAFARAYINFLNPADIITFRDRFDGYVFVDAKGKEYWALVELAPHQKIPDCAARLRSEKENMERRDPKLGSILADPEYAAFAEALAAEREAEECPPPAQTSVLEAALKEIEERDKAKKAAGAARTPLVEYMMEKREERFRKALEKRKAKEEESRKVREGKRDKREAERRERLRRPGEEGAPPPPLEAKEARREARGGAKDDRPTTKRTERRKEKGADSKPRGGKSGAEKGKKAEAVKSKDPPPPTKNFKPRPDDDSPASSKSTGKSYSKSARPSEDAPTSSSGEPKPTAEKNANEKPKRKKERPDMARYTPGASRRGGASSGKPKETSPTS